MTGVATSGWFRGNTTAALDSKIKRDNIIDWLLWSLFSSTPDLLVKEWEEELDYYVPFFGDVLGYDIERGKNPELQSLRLSVDPVSALHRPLIWYSVRRVRLPTLDQANTL